MGLVGACHPPDLAPPCNLILLAPESYSLAAKYATYKVLPHKHLQIAALNGSAVRGTLRVALSLGGPKARQNNFQEMRKIYILLISHCAIMCHNRSTDARSFVDPEFTTYERN